MFAALVSIRRHHRDNCCLRILLLKALSRMTERRRCSLLILMYNTELS